jgi:hypothetical protein
MSCGEPVWEAGPTLFTPWFFIFIVVFFLFVMYLAPIVA